MVQVVLVFILFHVCLFVAEQNGIQEGLETNYFQSVQACTTSADCHIFAECVQGTCRCKSPYKGDGVDYCAVAGDIATEEFMTDNQFLKKIEPHFLCWTNANAGLYWNAFMTYTVSSPVIIPLNVSGYNVVTFPGTSGGIPQPGQTTLFYPGKHLGFKISSSITAPFLSFTWTVSGIPITIIKDDKSSDWYRRECPAEISFSIPVTVPCPLQSNLVTTLTSNFKTILDANKLAHNFQSDAETYEIIFRESECAAGATVLNTAVYISVTTDPEVKRTGRGAYAMDLVWDLLVKSTVASIFDGTPVTLVPQAMRDIVIIDTAQYNNNDPIVQIIPPPPNPKDINLFGYPSSYFTFALFLTAFIFALCGFTILLGCLCWCCSRKKEDSDIEVV
jgi:hypothetical protein